MTHWAKKAKNENTETEGVWNGEGIMETFIFVSVYIFSGEAIKYEGKKGKQFHTDLNLGCLAPLYAIRKTEMWKNEYQR